MLEPSYVLYALVRRPAAEGEPDRFLLMMKQGLPSFPATKLRPSEDLYSALVRPMEEDLGLSPGSYFPEREAEALPNAGTSPRHQGLAREWRLYPLVVSITGEGREALCSRSDLMWWTLAEIAGSDPEPNIAAIAARIAGDPDYVGEPPDGPSMDAVACRWAADHEGAARVVRGRDVRRILAYGERAFNLRVADPYLPYHRQGLGYTWSFFTPKDKQDIHVHGAPAVELYGIIEGRFQLWHKPMNRRGALTWERETLEAGDWVEVDSLECHFGCWLDPQGLGTVIKAAGSGELAGVGRIGMAGKTTCKDCSMKGLCAFPPALAELEAQYKLPLGQRSYTRIAELCEKP